MVQEISEKSIIYVENQNASLKHDKECKKCSTKVENNTNYKILALTSYVSLNKFQFSIRFNASMAFLL